MKNKIKKFLVALLLTSFISANAHAVVLGFVTGGTMWIAAGVTGTFGALSLGDPDFWGFFFTIFDGEKKSDLIDGNDFQTRF